MEQQLVSQAQLIGDIAKHIQQLKLPAELKTRLLAGAAAQSEVETKPTGSSLSQTPPRSTAKVLQPLAAC